MEDKLFAYKNPSADAPRVCGPLSGMRLSVPANLLVRGWPTRAGSMALENYTAIEDATVVERLQSAGACLAGITRTSELGFGLAGDCAAAALDTDGIEAVLLNDTLGEARLAAAQAGAVGFKPSWGLVSRWGLIGLIPSMESLGILARKPDTIARVLGVMAGPDTNDFSMRKDIPDMASPAGKAPEGPRRAVVLRESLALLNPEETKAFHGALDRVQAAGVTVKEVSLPDFDLFRVAHQVVGSVEASSSAGKFDSVRYGHRAARTENWNEMYLKSRGESFGPLLKSFLFQGAYFQFKNYEAFEKASGIRRRLVEAVESLFAEAEVIVLPTRRAAAEATKARTVAEVYDALAFTLPANVAGLPAVSLPGGTRGGSAAPGLQLIGKSLTDGHLLALATQLLSTVQGGL